MPSLLSALLLADSGISASDRVTANRRLRVSGVRAGARYQVSYDKGVSWSPVQTAPLAKSRALYFNGQNNFVAIPDTSSLPSGNASYTLEAWIKPDVMGDRGIIGWGPWGSQSQVNALRLMGSGQIRHYWWGNDLDVNVGNLADGRWHHVAATFDGRTRKVYVDGVLKGSDVPSAHRVPVVAKNIRIGSTNNGEYFKGGIDDPAIWKRALTQDEITLRQTVRPNSGDPDLIALYSFDEASGTTASALGSAGSSLTGTLVNGPGFTTREIASSSVITTVDLELDIPDGTYTDGQVQVRDLDAQQSVEVEAFKVDTTAPTIRLTVPGGTDRTISSQINDDVISGTAEPGTRLSLLSKLGTVSAGNLKITADNGADIYLNGQLVGKTNDWTRPYDFTGLKIQAGRNVLAVLAYDVGGIAGLSGRFDVPSGAFGTSNLAGWKVLNVDPESSTDNSAASRDPNQWSLPSNWASVDFDDRSWSAAINVQAKTGQYPWGNRTGDPAWIWSADPYNHDAVLFRYTFEGTSGDVGQVVLADNINVSADGTFNYQLTPEQLKQLGQGGAKTLVGVQTDAAGNTGRSDVATFAVDTVGDPISITSIGGGDGKVSTEVVETGRGPLRFQVDQYTGYWNSNLSNLQAYVKNYNPATQKNRYSTQVEVIDFTDDQGGFAGELPFDRRWPAAEATNAWGTGGINNQFFAKVSAEFFLDQAGLYRFRTYNDDGVFLLVDGKLTINDPTLHPEVVFTGDANLAAGNHQLELFFFENGGEASLEFSVSKYDPVKKTWGPYKMMAKDPSFQSKSVLSPDNLVVGQATPNGTVYLRIGNTEIGSVTADASGTFTYALTAANLALLAQSRGQSQLVAYQRDAAGNLSTSAPGPVELKQKPPVVTIESIGSADSTVSGVVGDAVVVGRGEPNLVTTLRFGDSVLGQVQADANGQYAYTLTADNIKVIAQGSDKRIIASQSLESGLKGESAAFAFSVDTLAPVVSFGAVGYGDTRMSLNSLEIGRGPIQFQVDQYTGYWSSNLAELQSYVQKYNPSAQNTRYSTSTAVIDFTDDPKGFAGELPFDMRWPAAVATNAYGTGGINNQFFVKISSGFSVDKAGLYRFRTYNDDGVFLLVDGKTVIADPTLHPEAVFTGDISLDPGNHNLELYFFENGGEASLEFSTSYQDPLTKQWGSYQLVGQQSQLKSTSIQVIDNLVEGSAEPGRDVIVYLGSAELGRVRADQQGRFALNLSNSALAALDRVRNTVDSQIYAIQRDAAGNVGNSGLTVASAKLTPPVITLNAIGGSDGVVSSQPADLVIAGSAETGLELSIAFGGKTLAVVDVTSADGAFTYTLTPADIAAIGQGTGKSLLLRQQDLYGNVGTLTTPTFAVDTIPPDLRLPAPKDPAALGGIDATVSTQLGDAYLSGKGEANTPLTLSFGTTTRTVTANQSGDFSYELTADDISVLGQGTGKQIAITQSDAAGNVASQSINFDLDTIPPDKAVFTGLAGDGFVSGRPNDNVISGQADPNAQVTLLLNGAKFTTVTTNKNGLFSYAVTTTDISQIGQGSFTLTARLSDLAGNVAISDPSDLVIDTVAPVQPTIDSIGGADLTISTKDNKVVGKAEAKSTVTLSSNGKVLGTTVADDFGSFEYSVTSPNLVVLGQGGDKRIQIVAADRAGNRSTASEPFSFSVDTIAPGSPDISNIGGFDGVISSLPGDSSVTGRGEAESLISLRAVSSQGSLFEVSGIKLDNKGAWSYDFNGEQLAKLDAALASSSTIALQALAVDQAGNEGRSASTKVNIDLRGPEFVNLQLGGVDQVVSTQSGDSRVTGKGESNRAVTLSFNGSVLGTVMADREGLFTYGLKVTDFTRIGQGTNKQITVSQADAAGNVTRVLLPFAVDTVAPSSASIDAVGGLDKLVTAVDSDRVVRGNAEAGAIVTLRSIAGTLRRPLATFVVGDNETFQYKLTPQNLQDIAQGVGKKIEAISSDAAGNTTASREFNFAVQAQWKTGTTANDVIPFASGIDAITGLGGADRFTMASLGSVLATGDNLLSFDRILDFQVGVDSIDGPTAVASRSIPQLGLVQALSTTFLSNLLNSNTFAANGASLFTYQDNSDGLRTFLALNDRQAGFNVLTDGVVEITGYTGILSQLSVV